MEFCSSSLLRRVQEVMVYQVASAIASLIDGLKASPWCLQRTLDLEKISAMALNSTQLSLDLVSRVGADAQVSQQSMKPAGGDRSFSTEGFSLVSISVQLLALVVT
jgi:hypothetical protein